mmetsp:Transcript_46823/g.119456  ORF Transcript_46823/g.119456 Transcript_46823/m.119456 type:complete len:316 (+) Transcript_46823:73-1020(+)
MIPWGVAAPHALPHGAGTLCLTAMIVAGMQNCILFQHVLFGNKDPSDLLRLWPVQQHFQQPKHTCHAVASDQTAPVRPIVHTDAKRGQEARSGRQQGEAQQRLQASSWPRHHHVRPQQAADGPGCAHAGKVAGVEGEAGGSAPDGTGAQDEYVPKRPEPSLHKPQAPPGAQVCSKVEDVGMQQYRTEQSPVLARPQPARSQGPLIRRPRAQVRSTQYQADRRPGSPTLQVEAICDDDHENQRERRCRRRRCGPCQRGARRPAKLLPANFRQVPQQPPQEEQPDGERRQAGPQPIEGHREHRFLLAAQGCPAKRRL